MSPTKRQDINWTGEAQAESLDQNRVFRERGEQRYSLEILPINITFEVDRLRRDRDGLVGELSVSVGEQFKHAKTYNGIVSIGDINLSAVRSRTERANLIRQRSGAEHLDWHGYLEQFCIQVLQAERRGKPAVVLADVDPQQEKVRFWNVLDGVPVLSELPMVLFGDAASGKSILAMYLAGLLAQAQVNVLYADWEFSELEHRERLGRLFQPMPRNLFYVRCDSPLSHQTDRLLRLVREHKCQYLICDSIGFAVDGAAESAEAAMKYFRALRQMGIGSLNLAHIPKQHEDQREAQIYGCYSEDTEVLTMRGWRRHADLEATDRVLAFDPELQAYRYQQPTAFHQYQFTGELLHIETSTTDALVTPNHRCVVRPQVIPSAGHTVKPWKFIRASQFPRAIDVPLAASLDFRSDYPVAGGDDFLRFLGWWISEGSHHSKNGSFTLTQAEGELAEQMIATLDRLGYDYHALRTKPRPHEKTVVQITSRKKSLSVARWLAEECGRGAATKRLPSLAWKLSSRQQQVLLDALIDGDGSRFIYGGCRYHTVSMALADDVQRLAIECGHAASVRFQPPGKVWHYPQAYINISRTDRRSLTIYKARHVHSVKYDGTVYCLTVPSGAYVTRRNGKMAIYGNSTFFKAGARSAWFVDRAATNPKNEIRFALHHRKSNVGELLPSRGFRVVFGKTISLEAIDVKTVDELATGLPLLERVKLALSNGAITLKQLSDDLGVPAGSVRSIMSRHKSSFVKMGNKIGLVAEGVDF